MHSPQTNSATAQQPTAKVVAKDGLKRFEQDFYESNKAMKTTGCKDVRENDTQANLPDKLPSKLKLGEQRDAVQRTFEILDIRKQKATAIPPRR